MLRLVLEVRHTEEVRGWASSFSCFCPLSESHPMYFVFLLHFSPCLSLLSMCCAALLPQLHVLQGKTKSALPNALHVHDASFPNILQFRSKQTELSLKCSGSFFSPSLGAISNMCSFPAEEPQHQTGSEKGKNCTGENQLAVFFNAKPVLVILIKDYILSYVYVG